MRLPLRLVTAVTVVSALLLACGSDGDSTFQDPSGNGDGTGDGTSGGLGSSGSNGSSGDGTSGSGGPACAAKVAQAQRKPAHLFFVLDQSYSMVEPDPTRWTKVTNAFKTFLNNPLSKGVSAGLEMFPVKTENKCNAAAYAALDVPLKPLPGAAPFQGLLAQTPSFATAGTPTLFALQGVIPLAKANAEKNKEAKTAIVLMTDGYPQACEGQTDGAVGPAAAEVAKVKALVPTYVIGVGPNLASLNAIATAGGTGTAFLIDDKADPAAAEKKFVAAIDAIRGQTLSCDLAIPPPPAGETLDLKKVNVTYTPTSGAKQPLKYDEKCAAEGWKFDNPTTPTKIILCGATCNKVKADPTGSIGVEFGCVRREGDVK